MPDQETFDEIGVVLSLDRKGRTNATRVFINGDRVVKRVSIAEGRNSGKALEEALQNLGLVLHERGRRLIEFTQPEPVKMRVEHK